MSVHVPVPVVVATERFVQVVVDGVRCFSVPVPVVVAAERFVQVVVNGVRCFSVHWRATKVVVVVKRLIQVVFHYVQPVGVGGFRWVWCDACGWIVLVIFHSISGKKMPFDNPLLSCPNPCIPFCK